MNCTFCNGRNLFHTRIFYEGTFWWAALDSNPISPGNSILVCEQHRRDITECSEKELMELGAALKNVSDAVKIVFRNETLENHTALGLDASGEIVNIFLVALGEGEATNHLHFHIIPYYESYRKARQEAPGKMMSWLGERELLRDGGLERASLVDRSKDEYRTKVAEALRLEDIAAGLREAIEASAVG